MNAWKKAREIVGGCLPFIPRGKISPFGNFLFDGRYMYFSYRVFSPDESGDMLVMTSFLPDREPARESFSALGISGHGRVFFLLEDSIYDEPILFNQNFPAFSYKWEKEKESGLGALRFLRIDFSDNDFINYEGEELKVDFKMGKNEFFSSLPESLKEVPFILGTPIPHFINFEEVAEKIFRESKLEVFSKVLHAKYS